MKPTLIILFWAIVCLPRIAFSDSVGRMEPHTKIAGQYVFVMLPGQCVDNYSEVEMADAELNAFDAKFRKEQALLRKASENQERFDPCAYWRARERYERSRVKGNPGKYRICINSYKWMPTKSISPPGKLGRVYPASGLYLNDGSISRSQAPAWEREWGKSPALMFRKFKRMVVERRDIFALHEKVAECLIKKRNGRGRRSRIF